MYIVVASKYTTLLVLHWLFDYMALKAMCKYSILLTKQQSPSHPPKPNMLPQLQLGRRFSGCKHYSRNYTLMSIILHQSRVCRRIVLVMLSLQGFTAVPGNDDLSKMMSLETDTTLCIVGLYTFQPLNPSSKPRKMHLLEWGSSTSCSFFWMWMYARHPNVQYIVRSGFCPFQTS